MGAATWASAAPLHRLSAEFQNSTSIGGSGEISTTATPADAIGEPSKGRLHRGADADLVVLDPDLTVVATMIAGSPVWDPGRMLGGAA